MKHQLVRNFIVSFLLIAVVTGSGTFFLSHYYETHQAPANPEISFGDSAIKKDSNGPTVTSNAFVEPLQDDSLLAQTRRSYQVGDNITPTIDKDATLTQRFLQTASYQIIKSNPDGPTQEEDQVGLVLPNVDSILTNGLAQKDIAAQVPNWEKEGAAIQFAITDDVSAEPGYLDSLGQNMQQYLSEYGTTDITKQEFTTQSLNGASKDFQRGIDALTARAVPRKYADFHRSLIGLLVYEQRATGFAATNYNDPMRAGLAMQANQAGFNKAIFNLLREKDKLALSDIKVYNPRNPVIAFLTGLVTVQTARAIVVFDPVTHLYLNITLARYIWEFIFKELVRAFVRLLINQIQKDLVNWISGNGKPKFIQNWKDTLTNTFNNAAGIVISKEYPKLCKGFGPLVEINVTPISDLQDRESDSIQCTLEDIIDNVEKFRDDFRSGGWMAFVSLTRSENNYVGASFKLGDIITRQASKSKDAKKQNLVSSGGFNSTGVGCSTPDTTQYYESELDDLKARGLFDGNEIINIECGKNPDPKKNVCNVTTCLADDVQFKTPGSAVAHSLFGSLNWKPNQISVASSLVELAAALIDASINRLVNLAGGWISGSGGSGGSGNSAGITGSTSGDGLDASSTENPQNAQQEKDNALNIARTKLNQVRDLKEKYRQVVAAYNALLQNSQQCVNFKTDVQDPFDRIVTRYNELKIDAAEGKLIELINQIQALDIADPQFNAKLRELLRKVGDTPPDEDLGSLAGAVGQMQATIEGFRCRLTNSSTTPP